MERAYDFWGRDRSTWRDCYGIIRSLFYHEKLSYESICLQNILSTTPIIQNEIALRMMNATLAARTTTMLIKILIQFVPFDHQ